jgi:hypothetical protein
MCTKVAVRLSILYGFSAYFSVIYKPVTSIPKFGIARIYSLFFNWVENLQNVMDKQVYALFFVPFLQNYFTPINLPT